MSVDVPDVGFRDDPITEAEAKSNMYIDYTRLLNTLTFPYLKAHPIIYTDIGNIRQNTLKVISLIFLALLLDLDFKRPRSVGQEIGHYLKSTGF